MVSTKKCASEGKFTRKAYYKKNGTRVKKACVSPPGTSGAVKLGPRKPRKDKGIKRGPRKAKVEKVY